MKFLFANCFILLLSFGICGQGGGLDAEIGFQYVKAEYLFETSRFEECIFEYNQVIARNPSYKDALVKRGIAKYNMAAFKGAKMDALQSIDLKGITPDAAFILGKAEHTLGNVESALNSLSAAIALEHGVESLELRAKIYESTQQLLKACQDYNAAARLGSAVGEQKSKSLCGGYQTKVNPPVLKPKPLPEKSEPQRDENNSGNEDDEVEDTDMSDTQNPDQLPDRNTEDPTIPEEDNFVQYVSIDEELSIDIYGQGLGRRRITTTPSILIIADESGNVTLDICVNNAGEVIKAEFNATMSSIAKKSMVNLALRKAKEFEFEKSVYGSQCGYMVFRVKAN